LHHFIYPRVSADFRSFFLPREEAVAQTANELVGTWTLVSITLKKDGKTTDFYGPNPMGQRTYGADGRFSNIITRSDLPKLYPTIAWRELQKKTRPACREVLPSSVRTRSVTQIRLLPPISRAVRSRIGTGSSEKNLSASPATNSTSRVSLRLPPVELITWSGSAPNSYPYAVASLTIQCCLCSV
jgi:Lipocalin-like domain